ncbi:DUF4406 domain-containing protein [Aeromonas popoffii]|jgi:hypothetical protein|uniref:DUF4406 domain-containing protein n=1 Tax=Aeromonas popoffii TaxID=70856 RepID=UPI001FCD14CF|nr:DUF4406 domain-containing protein [Aeromonas popoffii]
MAKIYIAGPMTGLPNFNRDAFNAEAQRLLGLGHVALNSAIMTSVLHKETA